ncbi:hypothetical protein FB465_7028 [Kitasatospora atroaurantiaca]|uniref:HicB-like protein involved in pilus formation n=1 Tax=Kitasatospora atroaurantiaca TaxID=285545 RepID=A0A561F1V3_9ACTN|nr:hypothetical protein [Kitasatospora atroaurantiaca]TWE21802.1 hypothetical protein FB465_7028 [Kitasatospora atroaurantiaca]
MSTLVELPERLEKAVRAAASEAGLSVNDYVARVLTADQAAAEGSPAERAARADALAAAAHRQWVAGGHSEVGSMSMGEVFGL